MVKIGVTIEQYISCPNWCTQNVSIKQDSIHLEVCINFHKYNVDVIVSVDNNNYIDINHINNIYSNILLVHALFAIKKVEPACQTR